MPDRFVLAVQASRLLGGKSEIRNSKFEIPSAPTARCYHGLMESGQGEDLGHGVFVSPLPGGELIVTSPRLDLELRVAMGQTPGTAVLWREHFYEVIGRAAAGAGDRWVLRLWEQASAMRGVVRLDAEMVSVLEERADTQRRRQRMRMWTMPLLPLLGLAPARLQKHWAEKWNFPAESATWLSTFAEILVGSLGLIQALALAFGGGWFLPAWLHWAAVVGPLLVVEGMVRLALVAADSEPVGSALGLPLGLLAPRKEPYRETTAPELRRLDESDGILELVSPIFRKDWDGGGILRYRGRVYRLDRIGQEGRFWVYRFKRCPDAEPTGTIMHLLPPPGKTYVPPHMELEPPSFLRTMLTTAAVTLGPRSDQELWGAHLGVRPIWLTMMGAAAELVGGLVNLRSDLASTGLLVLVLDFFLVGEGLLRLGSVATGRPMGSVFGWILRPLYRRSLPPARAQGTGHRVQGGP